MAEEPTGEEFARKLFYIVLAACLGYAAAAYLLIG
jgi:hypothetical protein